MADPTWKVAEREIAKRLGGVRVPITGRIRGSAPDIAHARWALEVKLRSHLPSLLTDAMDQAVKSIRGEQIPLVVLHEKGTRYDDDLVCLRLVDFLKLTACTATSCARTDETRDGTQEGGMP
jgi:hypothetical protein